MNSDHVAIVQQGAEAIKEWRAANPGVKLDLRQADLHGAIMPAGFVDTTNDDTTGPAPRGPVHGEPEPIRLRAKKGDAARERNLAASKGTKTD